MTNQQDIEEFIESVHRDLMNIYNISNEEATSLLVDFRIRDLIAEFGELVAHYPSQELAKMAYEKKVPQNH